MRQPRTRTLLLAASLALALPLVGCVVAPAPYYGDMVTVAPPPPQAEYIGAPPVVGYIWIGGYWTWQAGRHVWIGGHWAPPRPGYRWVPHHWKRDGQGWREQPGYWSRR
jgi:hypothetical protein